MKRSNLNFIVDGIAFIGLVALITTGLVMRFVVPPLKRGEGGDLPHTMLWGLDRHQWGEVHFWIATGLMAIMVIHLFLHWKWIVSVVQGKPGEGSGIRAFLGILSLVVLLIAAALPFLSPTEQKTHSGKPSTSKKHRAIPNAQDPFLEEIMELQREFNTEEQPSLRESGKENVQAMNIRGGMTLQEVEDVTGVPVQFLLEQLKLPEDTASDEKLGRLRKQYEFDMQDVRTLVKEYKQ